MSTILVIDDYTMFQDLIVFALKQEGYNVLAVSNAKDALAGLHLSNPDLILLDMLMPEIDGLHFLRILRSKPGHKHTPVMVITGSCEREQVIRAADFGIQDYILKSQFSLDKLLARIKSRLESPKPCLVRDAHS